MNALAARNSPLQYSRSDSKLVMAVPRRAARTARSRRTPARGCAAAAGTPATRAAPRAPLPAAGASAPAGSRTRSARAAALAQLRVVQVAQPDVDHEDLRIGRERAALAAARGPQFLRGAAGGVLHDLGGLLGPARARAEDQRVQHLPHARDAIALVDAVRHVALGVHDHEHDPVHRAWRQAAEGLVQRTAGDRVVDEPAHAEVVGESAVDQVDVRAAAARCGSCRRSCRRNRAERLRSARCVVRRAARRAGRCPHSCAPSSGSAAAAPTTTRPPRTTAARCPGPSRSARTAPA